MILEAGISDILNSCRLEFIKSIDNDDNNRNLVKLLQKLSIQKFDNIDLHEDIEELLTRIWKHPVVLEDCILVSGIIFAKLYPELEYSSLCEKALVENLDNSDWIKMSLIRGMIQDRDFRLFSGQLEQLGRLTASSIDDGLSRSRIVLICRHLENLLHIFNIEYDLGAYDINSRGDQIKNIIGRALRLNSDLMDHKSRDLIKFHLNVISLVGSSDDCSHFTSNILDCLPEMNKISIQIFDSLCTLKFQEQSIFLRIFKLTLPCLK